MESSPFAPIGDESHIEAFQTIVKSFGNLSGNMSMLEPERLHAALEYTGDARLASLAPLSSSAHGSVILRGSEVYSYHNEWGLFWGKFTTANPEYVLLRLGMERLNGSWINTTAGYYVAGPILPGPLVPFMNETYITGDAARYDRIRPLTTPEPARIAGELVLAATRLPAPRLPRYM